MNKFYGVVGFATEVESPANSGVWTTTVVEKSYYGDVIRDTRKFDGSERVNVDISVGNSISVVKDAYISERIHQIRYVNWAGTLWAVTTVEVQSPRLILRLGGVYNGPKV